MPTDQSSSGRRQHFNRGRRPDRRGGEQRPRAQAQEQPRSDQVDVDQVMREIRARIAQRHGIDLTHQQIQELAARRLEAILDPRTLKPSLLEQLRKSAGDVLGAGTKEAAPAYAFEDTTLYESHNGFLRIARRLLNPLLKLFFNPNPLIQALNTQARLNAEYARREDERDRRQAEWNALHYTILQRVVLELSRSTVDAQTLAARVESIGARLDFNDRRLRAVEGSGAGPAPRPAEAASSASLASAGTAGSSAAASPVSSSVSMRAAGGDGAVGDASPEARRRRRRRRGRRIGAPSEGGPMPPAAGHRDAEEGGDEPDEANRAGAEHDSAAVSHQAPPQAPVPPQSSEAPPAASGSDADIPDR